MIHFQMMAQSCINQSKNVPKNKISFSCHDWRDIPEGEKYDGVICSEMSEHVGSQYWDPFYKKISLLMKPNAKFFLQVWMTAESNPFVGSEFICNKFYGSVRLPRMSELAKVIISLF